MCVLGLLVSTPQYWQASALSFNQQLQESVGGLLNYRLLPFSVCLGLTSTCLLSDSERQKSSVCEAQIGDGSSLSLLPCCQNGVLNLVHAIPISTQRWGPQLNRKNLYSRDQGDTERHGAGVGFYTPTQTAFLYTCASCTLFSSHGKCQQASR